jgi:hypothetical protein
MLLHCGTGSELRVYLCLAMQHPYRFETDVPRLNLIVKNSGCKV